MGDHGGIQDQVLTAHAEQGHDKGEALDQVVGLFLDRREWDMFGQRRLESCLHFVCVDSSSEQLIVKIKNKTFRIRITMILFLMCRLSLANDDEDYLPACLPSFLLIALASPEALPCVQLDRKTFFLKSPLKYKMQVQKLTRDRLHSKKVVLSARHLSGTLPSVRLRHSRGVILS